jgi:hypothetical protein
MLKSTTRRSKAASAGAGSKNGKMRLAKDGIFLTQGDEPETRIADPILVTAFATGREPGTKKELAFTVIRFQNRRGKWKSEDVPSSMLIPGRQEFITLLSTRGYSWPPTPKSYPQIIGALAAERPLREIRIVPVPGWHGKFFALPGECYGPDGPENKSLRIGHSDAVGLGAFRRSGTFDGWKYGVAKNCVQSSRARLALAANFAAPNLSMMGMDSFGINFSGGTSGGKTLLLRLSASTPGLNDNGGPATWDGTPAGLEQRIQGHRHCVMSLDDIGYLEGDPKVMLKLVTFRLAGNRSKQKAGQYVRSQNLSDADSRVIALSTSETPLWAHLDSAGRRRIRGEEVRMINVRACVSEMDDVFDGPDACETIGKTVEERRLSVKRSEGNAQKDQGEAFRAYLVKRAADKGAKSALDAYMADYTEKAPLPDQQRWLGRIQQYFALIYAGAAQAIDYGILPWAKTGTLRAIKSCMDDAMEQLVEAADDGSNAGRLPSDEALLTEFQRLAKNAEFVQLDGNRKSDRRMAARLKKADGIIRPAGQGKVERLLFGSAFDAWFPDVTARRRLTALLRSHAIFKEGRRSDTATRQIHIAEMGGKIPCYAMSSKRLRAYTQR